MIRVTPFIILADDEIEERFLRAPGPGGQNVNKVETAVQLRFDAAGSPALDEGMLRRLAPLAGRRMTRDGVIVINANRFRTRERNRSDALDRLIDLIRAAAVPPKPRRATRPSAGARRRRLDDKRQRSVLKKRRGKVDDSD